MRVSHHECTKVWEGNGFSGDWEGDLALFPSGNEGGVFYP